MIGIYKITSPSKKVYIGQSANIYKRFTYYKNLDCKGQTILYRSLLKYGVDKHKFEILCECEVSELNEKERYYQDLYSAVSISGMNCILTKASDRKSEVSDETRKKLSISSTGHPVSKETREKLRVAKLGKKNSPESNEKQRQSMLGKNTWMKGTTQSEESKNKKRIKSLGNIYGAKKVINMDTLEIFNSAKQAALMNSIRYKTLVNWLSGVFPNKSKLVYVNKVNPIKGKDFGVVISAYANRDFLGSKNPFFGKTHSEETKLKMRKKRKLRNVNKLKK